MNDQQRHKVTARHLARAAYLYVRQATRRQGFANAETLRRHVRLRQQAVVLGWPVESVMVIDSDIGQSGASQRDRPGFRQLLRQIELGCVGIALALEPTRWARNVTDWHRLLDACALHDTLLLDEEGLYDPADATDRVLLGCAEAISATVEFSRCK